MAIRVAIVLVALAAGDVAPTREGLVVSLRRSKTEVGR